MTTKTEYGHYLCRWHETTSEWWAGTDGTDSDEWRTGCTDRTGGAHRPIDPIEEPVPLARLANSFNETVAGFAARLDWPDFAAITD